MSGLSSRWLPIWHLVAATPVTQAVQAVISGLGARKLEAYGDAVLGVIEALEAR